nr:DUF3422 family protein [Bosea sp. F3-2]
MQQAVEDLSVIAITYYTIGLVKVCLEGLIEFGLDPHRAKQLVIAAIPAVLWAVWKAVRHVRKNSWSGWSCAGVFQARFCFRPRSPLALLGSLGRWAKKCISRPYPAQSRLRI